MKRELIFSTEFIDFKQSVGKRARNKLDYLIGMLENIDVIPSLFVKKLTSTDFYELRISVDNEVRVILFAIDDLNINLSKRVVLLNGFIKKSTSDYEKELVKAINILNRAL